MSAQGNLVGAARHLVRSELIGPAEERLRAAEREHAAAAAAVDAAEVALETARRQPERLWRQAVDGAKISDADLDAIFNAEARAAHRLGFRRRFAEHLAEKVAGVQRAVEAARDQAHLPLLRHAIEIRISAAAKAEKFRATASRHENASELAAARAEFESTAPAFAIVNEGSTLLRGTTVPPFGLSASQEARVWRTFLPADHAAAA